MSQGRVIQPGEKVYITRHGLTQGIMVITGEGRITAEGYFIWNLGSFDGLHVAKRDYTLNAEEALARVDDMRKRKIESHEKSLKKLRTYVPKFKELNGGTSD